MEPLVTDQRCKETTQYGPKALRIPRSIKKSKASARVAEEIAMSKETPNDDPRQRTDWKNTKQTDEPWKGPPEKEQKRTGPPPDLEKWHETNTN
jgi:hypothetical protein